MITAVDGDNGRAPGRFARRRGTASLRVGVATIWLSVIVLLPLAAILSQSVDGGWEAFYRAVTGNAALESFRVTLSISVGVTIVNAFFGLLVAWVRSSGWPASRTATPTSSPAGSGSGWRWPARWRSIRRCCCSTSRSAPLDAKVREDLRAWLRRLHDEVHVTTVLVTHDQAEALDVADRIAVLNKGRIEQVGSPTEVYDTPANAFVMSFLGAVSSLNGTLVRPHDIRVGRNPELPIYESESIQATGVVKAGINRIVVLGFEVRLELTNAATQAPFTAQITRGDAEALGLREGETVYVRATRVPEIPGDTEVPKAAALR